MEFSGKLGPVPFGNLLQWIEGDRRTGMLVVRQPHREKCVAFREGAVVACFSDSPGDSYGRFLLLHGHLDEESLSAALLRCREERLPLRAAVQELGLLPAETVDATLAEQLEDQICDLFFWRDGIFFFEPGESGSFPSVPAAVPAVRLAMEGARRVDEINRLRSMLPDDEARVDKTDRAAGGALAPLPQRILRTVRGPVSVAILFREIQGSYFRFLEALGQLVDGELLRVTTGRGTGSPRGTTPPVGELLLKQAVYERLLLQEEHVPLPRGVLEGLYPLWVTERPPEGEELPEEVRGFLGGLDGSRPLAELLSEGQRERARELELLMRYLGEGRLALLPAAVDEVVLPRRGGLWFRRARKA